MRLRNQCYRFRDKVSGHEDPRRTGRARPWLHDDLHVAAQQHEEPQQAIEREPGKAASDQGRHLWLVDLQELCCCGLRQSAPGDERRIETTGTPLIRAARMGSVELVKVFLAAKADVHSTTRDGATALTEAIRGGHEEVVGLLRAAGADAAATPVERPGR